MKVWGVVRSRKPFTYWWLLCDPCLSALVYEMAEYSKYSSFPFLSFSHNIHRPIQYSIYWYYTRTAYRANRLSASIYFTQRVISICNQLDKDTNYPRRQRSRGQLCYFCSSVRLSDFPHYMSKTDAAKITKLDIIYSKLPPWVMEIHFILGSKLKRSEVKVTRHKNVGGVGHYWSVLASSSSSTPLNSLVWKL